ncbi:MAG: hypothetical protein ACXU7O_00585 [Croceibacterium sp.]
MTTFKKLILGTALAATSLTMAAPASAQDYRRHRGGDDATAAVVGGVIGLALGAALVSSSHHSHAHYRNGTWYEGYYYRNGGFYDRQGQLRYNRDTWDRRGYDQRGYDQRGAYDQRGGCDQRGYDQRGGYDQRDGDRDDDRGQYDNRYNQGAYNGGYNTGGYNTGGYNGGGYYGY